MSKFLLNRIENAKFRINPKHELYFFDRLSHKKQAEYYSLRQHSNFYKMLFFSENPEVKAKGVNQDTALFYRTMRAPGPLPSYVKLQLGNRYPKVIATLVLDEILEIEYDNMFVSGARAHNIFFERSKSNPKAIKGKLARLSMDALKYAQTLDLDDPMILSTRLYFYNRYPLSPLWKEKLPTSEAVANYLGILNKGKNEAILNQYWRSVRLPEGYDTVWLSWKLLTNEIHKHLTDRTYKLYISPTIDSLPEIFQAVLEKITELRIPQFKIGREISSLLRPDKLIIYCNNFQQLQETSKRLSSVLVGCGVHGVPFTAELAGEGLLSWGIDPPRRKRLSRSEERESWRLWVTNRLAKGILAAKASRLKVFEPWEFAVDRLKLEGVDTVTWIPDKSLWYNPAREE